MKQNTTLAYECSRCGRTFTDEKPQRTILTCPTCKRDGPFRVSYVE